jgi:hypothetical protein
MQNCVLGKSDLEDLTKLSGELARQRPIKWTFDGAPVA